MGTTINVLEVDLGNESQKAHQEFLDQCSTHEDISITRTENLQKTDTSDYDAMLFLCQGDWEEQSLNDEAEQIKEAMDAGKIIVALGNAPLVLAKSGLLKNKHATANKPEGDSELERKMLEFGTFYDASQPIVQDENIISAQDDAETLASLSRVIPVFLRQQKQRQES